LGQRSWVDRALEQFNSDGFDFGAWMERRRQAFVNSSVRNPYFQYSLWSTLGLLLMFILCAKLRIDNQRILWVTAEQMADLHNQDVLSRAAAHEAITKYNEHIESCNQAFESGVLGRSRGFLISPTAQSELERMRNELIKAQARIAELSCENERKAKTLASLSVRLDGATSVRDVTGAAATLDTSRADPNLIRHINTLQEQLHASQKEVRRLKGA
jgi:hypothetical protein